MKKIDIRLRSFKPKMLNNFPKFLVIKCDDNALQSEEQVQVDFKHNYLVKIVKKVPNKLCLH